MEVTAQRSQLRHRRIYAKPQVPPITSRRSLPSQELRFLQGQGRENEPTETTHSYQYYQKPANTDEDEMIDPSLQTQTRWENSRAMIIAAPAPQHPQRPSSGRERRSMHPAFWIGLTLIAVLIGWVATTSGASLWVTHISDPSTYGPTHGNIITLPLGGGDSQQNPSKLIAINNDGQVEVIKLLANQESKGQIITGPNLRAIHFPDPKGAVIELAPDGQGAKLTIYSTSFDYPFHRYQQAYELISDGKGGLKWLSLAGGQQ